MINIWYFKSRKFKIAIFVPFNGLESITYSWFNQLSLHKIILVISIEWPWVAWLESRVSNTCLLPDTVKLVAVSSKKARDCTCFYEARCMNNDYWRQQLSFILQDHDGNCFIFYNGFRKILSRCCCTWRPFCQISCIACRTHGYLNNQQYSPLQSIQLYFVGAYLWSFF